MIQILSRQNSMRRRISRFGRMSAAICCAAAIASCAGFNRTPVPGSSEKEVIALLGTPTHIYQDEHGHSLEYMHGPWRQTTWMARIDAGGKLVSYEQVLSARNFASIPVGSARKEDVLRIIGAPGSTSYLPLSRLEAWSYPYRENGAWDSIMHVHFDERGVVRKMANGPDLRRDPDNHWPLPD